MNTEMFAKCTTWLILADNNGVRISRSFTIGFNGSCNLENPVAIKPKHSERNTQVHKECLASHRLSSNPIISKIDNPIKKLVFKQWIDEMHSKR